MFLLPNYYKLDLKRVFFEGAYFTTADNAVLQAHAYTFTELH